MSRAEKLVAKLLSGRSDKNFSFDDLCHVVERAGFDSRGGKGSHRVYYKNEVVEIINVSHAVAAKPSLTKLNKCANCS